MALSPKTEELMRHIVLLHSLKEAGPEVHAALMGQNVPEEQVHQHLLANAKKLHGDIQASAQGGQGAPPPDGKGKSTASRAMALADQFEKAEPAKADNGAADRRAKLGRIFPK